MKIFSTRKNKKEVNKKDEYQTIVEKFGTEQLRKLADKGLRLPVVML